MIFDEVGNSSEKVIPCVPEWSYVESVGQSLVVCHTVSDDVTVIVACKALDRVVTLAGL